MKKFVFLGYNIILGNDAKILARRLNYILI